jgi:hypothetical protein
MEKYFFFAVIVITEHGLIKKSISGTFVDFDGYNTMSDVMKFAKERVGKKIARTDRVVLTGFSELTKEHFEALKDEKRA